VAGEEEECDIGLQCTPLPGQQHVAKRPSNSGPDAKTPTLSPASREEEYVARQLEKVAAGQDQDS